MEHLLRDCLENSDETKNEAIKDGNDSAVEPLIVNDPTVPLKRKRGSLDELSGTDWKRVKTCDVKVITEPNLMANDIGMSSLEPNAVQEFFDQFCHELRTEGWTDREVNNSMVESVCLTFGEGTAVTHEERHNKEVKFPYLEETHSVVHDHKVARVMQHSELDTMTMMVDSLANRSDGMAQTLGQLLQRMMTRLRVYRLDTLYAHLKTNRTSQFTYSSLPFLDDP